MQEAWGTYIFLRGWLKWKPSENHLNAGINITDDICFSLIADLEIKRNLKYFIISENLVLLPPLTFWLVFSFPWKEDWCLICSQSFERHWVKVVKKIYKGADECKILSVGVGILLHQEMLAGNVARCWQLCASTYWACKQMKVRVLRLHVFLSYDSCLLKRNMFCAITAWKKQWEYEQTATLAIAYSLIFCNILCTTLVYNCSFYLNTFEYKVIMLIYIYIYIPYIYTPRQLG